LFLRKGPLGSAVRRGRRKKHLCFVNAPGASITPVTGSGGSLCRGAISSGAFWDYLSGPAAVARAGERMRRPLRTADPSGPICESTESLNLGRNKRPRSSYTSLAPFDMPAPAAALIPVQRVLNVSKQPSHHGFHRALELNNLRSGSGQSRNSSRFNLSPELHG
jgi:hypothetical protein